jgi:hypothetical protein
MVHECPHCDYKSEKAFNVKRHTIRNHTVHDITEKNQPQKYAQNVENVVTLVANDVTLVANDVTLVANDVTLVASAKLPLECGKCKKHFSRKDRFVKHEANCKGHPLQCEVCKIYFINKFAKYHHKKKEKCQPPVENAQSYVTNNITNNNITNNNIHNDNSKHIHINNFISFNTPNNDPIEFKTDHIDNPSVLKQIFAQTEFSSMFSDFADAVFEAPENQIVQKNNMSRDFCTVYIQETGQWERKMDQQVFHKVARGISTSALTLSEKHSRKAHLSTQHRENLRDISVDCEFSPSDNYDDEDARYHKKTRDAIRMLKMKMYGNTMAKREK